MTTLAPHQRRTRILAILEPIHALDPVLDSLYGLVSQAPDELPEEILVSIDSILTGMLTHASGRLDSEQAASIATAIGRIRLLEASDRETVEDPKNAIF